MALNFRGTKLSRIENCRVFRVFFRGCASHNIMVVVSKMAQRMFEVESCIRGYHVYGAV